MSLAALAGYASDSDASDDDLEVKPQSKDDSKSQSPQPGPSHTTTINEGVDTIVDDDDIFSNSEPLVHKSSFDNSLFMSLPAPKKEDAIVEEEDVSDIKPFVPVKPAEASKETKKRIMLPKLSDLSDDEDEDRPKKPKIQKSVKGSGLLKMLPPPSSLKIATGSKTSLTQLKPHSLTKKPVAPPVRKPVTPVRKIKVDEEEEDKDDGESSFFSFDEPKLSDEQLKNLIKAEDLQPKVRKAPVVVEEVQPGPSYVEDIREEPLPAVAVPSTSLHEELPEEALQQLRGRRKNEKIEILSIDAADFTAEARQNLVRNLTEQETTSRSKSGANEPGRMHKSKHHITHLAFMAKERENDLKNQWAANRMTKRETQQKYGF